MNRNKRRSLLSILISVLCVVLLITLCWHIIALLDYPLLVECSCGGVAAVQRRKMASINGRCIESLISLFFLFAENSQLSGFTNPTLH